jgi:hypothetical protein
MKQRLTALERRDIMRDPRLFLLLLALGACSSATVSAPTGDPLVSVVGPLTFTVSDAPALPGVSWIAPTAEGTRGAVTAYAIRYGSLCSTAVSARADVTGSQVYLHVAFAFRQGVACSQEIRALQYNARLAGLSAGRFIVHILHSEDGGATETEVRTQSVDVS